MEHLKFLLWLGPCSSNRYNNADYQWHAIYYYGWWGTMRTEKKWLVMSGCDPEASKFLCQWQLENCTYLIVIDPLFILTTRMFLFQGNLLMGISLMLFIRVWQIRLFPPPKIWLYTFYGPKILLSFSLINPLVWLDVIKATNWAALVRKPLSISN
jgi:hypothetical protein